MPAEKFMKYMETFRNVKLADRDVQGVVVKVKERLRRENPGIEDCVLELEAVRRTALWSMEKFDGNTNGRFKQTLDKIAIEKHTGNEVYDWECAQEDLAYQIHQYTSETKYTSF